MVGYSALVVCHVVWIWARDAVGMLIGLRPASRYRHEPCDRVIAKAPKFFLRLLDAYVLILVVVHSPWKKRSDSFKGIGLFERLLLLEHKSR